MCGEMLVEDSCALTDFWEVVRYGLIVRGLYCICVCIQGKNVALKFRRVREVCTERRERSEYRRKMGRYGRKEVEIEVK